MQLDRTEIVIRQRSALELLDLSLLVLKRHFRPIVLSSLLLGLPLLLADVVVTAWVVGEDAQMAIEHVESPLVLLRWRHFAHLLVLYFVQFPLLSLPTTILLGGLIFYQRLSMRELIGRLWPIAWRTLFVLGVFRMGLVALVIEFFVDPTVAFDWKTELPLLVAIPILVLIMRSCWPLAPEIIGLEDCPLFPDKSKGKITTYRQRSRWLHGVLMADHVARFVLVGFYSTLLFLMLMGIQLFVAGVTFGHWQWAAWCDHFALPITLWSIGNLIAVFRFLSYLDSRIRLEGWEIELRMRAEATRLAEPSRVTTGSSGKLTEQVVA